MDDPTPPARSAPRERGGRARERDTRTRLLDSAGALMHARGYEAVGIADICAAAGAKKGSFYHWYGSKQDLALALLDRWWRATRRSYERAFTADVPPLERFDRWAALNADRRSPTLEVPVRGCPFGNLALELSYREPDFRDRLAGIFAEMTAFFRSALVDAQAAGDVADVDPDRAADAILALMEGRYLLAKVRNDPSVLRGLGADVRGLLGLPP